MTVGLLGVLLLSDLLVRMLNMTLKAQSAVASRTMVLSVMNLVVPPTSDAGVFPVYGFGFAMPLMT